MDLICFPLTRKSSDFLLTFIQTHDLHFQRFKFDSGFIKILPKRTIKEMRYECEKLIVNKIESNSCHIIDQKKGTPNIPSLSSATSSPIFRFSLILFGKL